MAGVSAMSEWVTANRLAEPFVLSQASGGAARPVGEPVPTIATGGAVALIAPYYGSGSGETCTTVENPLPTATAKARFGLVVPITHTDRSNRARNVETELLPTITTAKRGELALVEGVGEEPHYDILYRMLQPHELGPAMGFDKYEFAGTKTEQIKQIGNAVSVKLMKACVKSIMQDFVKPEMREAA
jgi:DNA (cytosine-5)-methyltransferase 1